MSNVIGLTARPGLEPCWLCHARVDVRVMFCSRCGALQPPRAATHYERLGVAAGVDVDRENLDTRYEALRRILAAERFTAKGLGERSLAARHREALDEAYQVLKDPLSRGRYWLSLNPADTARAEGPQPAANDVPVTIQDLPLQAELAEAMTAQELDLLAQRAIGTFEDGLMTLLDRLRRQEWQAATEILARLDQMEAIMAQIRQKRVFITEGPGASQEPPPAKD